MTDQQKLGDKIPVSTVVTPGPFAIDWRDAGYGALYALAATLIPLIQQMVDSWHFDPKTLLQTALHTFFGYLIVKYFSATRQITTFKKPSN
jgi:hypothetical protein